jgi:deoxycytidylate deaminase
MNILSEVINVAKQSGCNDARCGSIIVKDGIIIGKGFNSPPGNLESQRRCHIKKDHYHKKVSDKSCCIHAEERAIMDALRNNPDKIKGSTLYFGKDLVS